MKKIIATVLALMLVLSLCACGGGEPIRGEQIENNGGSNVEPTDGNVPDETEEEETEAESLSLGVTSGLTYESKFIGIGCNLPEGWSFYTDEQMRELNNIAIDAAGEELQSLMETATVIYDMFASDANGLSNIVVNLEKKSVIELIAMDLEQTLENTIPLLQSSLENIGYTDVECQVGTVTIDGQEFVCLNAVSQISGMQMNQCTISIKCNGYLASVSITCLGEDALSQLLNNFYIVE